MFIIPDNNKWSCLPAAFSMACGASFSMFIEMIGHNGDARPFKDTTKRRGFNLQECIDVAWQLGFATTAIDKIPALMHTLGSTDIVKVYSDEAGLARFMHYLSSTKQGVLEGMRHRLDGSLAGHACAWDGFLVFDPSHRVYKFEDCERNNFHVTGLLIVTEVWNG